MNYGLAESEIAKVINDKFTELNLSAKYFAAAMPETDKEMKEFEAQIIKSRVAVEYMTSDFERCSDLGIVRQTETVHFRLIFDGKRLRGEDGLFTMIGYIKKFLLGYKIPDCDPLVISAYGKTQFEPGIWMPHIDFACKTMNVQVIESDFDQVIGSEFTELIYTPDTFTSEFDEKQFV